MHTESALQMAHRSGRTPDLEHVVCQYWMILPNLKVPWGAAQQDCSQPATSTTCMAPGTQSWSRVHLLLEAGKACRGKGLGSTVQGATVRATALLHAEAGRQGLSRHASAGACKQTWSLQLQQDFKRQLRDQRALRSGQAALP